MTVPLRIFVNGRIYTFDSQSTLADCLAVAAGKIVAVGDTVSRMPRKGCPAYSETDVVDLGGKTVIPGLIDSHTHLIDYGVESTRSADLTGSRSIREVQERLRAFRKSRPNSPWLLGRRFDQELFSEGRWITRRDLDEVSTTVPILISRLCLHAVVANSVAIEPVRGELSTEQAETGILTEDAMTLLWRQVPPVTLDERVSAAKWALEEARRVGLCGIHCIVDSWEDIEALNRLYKSDWYTIRQSHAQGKSPVGCPDGTSESCCNRDLPVRLTLLCPVSMLPKLASEGIHTGCGDDYIRFGAIKVFTDGAMGPRTAAMREPFADDPSNKGILFRNERELAELLEEIHRHGFQAAIHAIGDLAIECALEGIKIAAKSIGGNGLLRPRIEHASQMSEDLIEQMASLGVVACVQPQFVITDFWTKERVGTARYRWSYPFKSMLSAGITLAMGSDCPVERLDPIELICCAVNREQFSLAERLSVAEVIKAYSFGSAYAGLNEDRLGSLEPGKMADFVVTEQNLFEMPPQELATLKVANAVVGGLP